MQSAEWFSRQGHEVVIIDNASNYAPLLDWYGCCGHTVYRLTKNIGHLAPWITGIVRDDAFYAVTDPDLSYDGIPSDWEQVCIEGFKYGAYTKVGFSLDETLIPSVNPAWILDEFYAFPKGDHPARWSNALKLGKYIQYPIDTTFAVYRPHAPFRIGGWRTDRPYTARHLPWHLVVDVDSSSPAFQIPITDEIHHYFITASDVSQSKSRMTQLLEQYAIKTGKTSYQLGFPPSARK